MANAKTITTAEQKAMVRDVGYRINHDNHINDALCNEHGCQMPTMDARNDILEEALRSIASWAKAYPYEVFPEPDFGRAAELLKAGGITIDSVAASCMRRVVQGVAKIAQEALDAK